MRERERLSLKPGESPPSMIKAGGVWIHFGAPEEPVAWDRLIDDIRDERAAQVMGLTDSDAFIGCREVAAIDREYARSYGPRMPTLSTFFGIVIRMYARDHAPPHFHAFYQEDEALIAIDGLEIIGGSLPRRALGLVLDWAELHRAELKENWRRARQHLELSSIDPLE